MLTRERHIVDFATEPTGRQRVARRTARYVAIITGASALLIGSTAAAYVAFRPATVPIVDQVRCYSKASLEGGDTDFYGTTVTHAAAPDGTRNAGTAIEACSPLWRQALMRINDKQVGGPDTGRFDHPVPPLVACTLDNGVAAVFPGDERTCARLGLPRLAE
jgi:hypothetical protein